MLNIFMSYAKEDQKTVLSYYDRLLAAGHDPWMDCKKLLPGQNWSMEIDRAFNAAHVVLLFLSPRSVSKRGFVQREANDAIEKLRFKLPTDVYVVPIVLEPCEVPTHISNRLQYVDVSVEGAWAQVEASLLLAAEQQAIELVKGISAGPFQVFTKELEEHGEGSPGYDVSIAYPEFQAKQHAASASELSNLFAGRAVKTLLGCRAKPWEQNLDPEAPQHWRDGHWETFAIAHANDSILSIAYSVDWYGAGAVHGNSHYETHTFLLSPHVVQLALTDFFENADAALEVISDSCIRRITREYWERCGEVPDETALEWINSGAGKKWENFDAFTVGADRFTFYFHPYQVAAYAFSTWSIEVSFFDLLTTFRKDGPHQLAMRPSA